MIPYGRRKETILNEGLVSIFYVTTTTITVTVTVTVTKSAGVRFFERQAADRQSPGPVGGGDLASFRTGGEAACSGPGQRSGSFCSTRG